MSVSNAADLFNTAEEFGELSSDSVALLDPLQTEINAALAQGEKKRAAKVVLVSTGNDNSPSMGHIGPGTAKTNWELACEGHDLIMTSLAGSKAASEILAHSTYINEFDGNSGIHFEFRDLVLPGHTAKNPKFNFVPLPPKTRLLGGTPLCSWMLRVLGTVQAQSTVYTQDGSEVFSISIFLTDGGNNDWNCKPSEVKTLVEDMRRQERHMIYLGGIDDGVTNYEAFGAECGLDPDCVKGLPNDPSAIRAWLQQVSQSAVAGSEAADINSFSQVKL